MLVIRRRSSLLGLFFHAGILLQVFAAEIPTDSSRAETLQSIGLEKVAQLEFEARRKIAIVLTGQSVNPTATTNKSIHVIIPGAPRSHLGIALAVAVDQRGYFLTAAHVAADEPLSLVFYDGKQLRALPARVVAKLATSRHEATKKLDVALLHVDAELTQVFQWADLSEVRRSDSLFQIGRTLRQQSDTNGVVAPVAFTAKFKRKTKLRDGGTAFRMESPARRGDSGGPILTMGGKLLGIECGSVQPFLRRNYELANRPDLKWLRDAMDQDHPPSREPIEPSGTIDSVGSLTITVPLLE